MLLTSHIAYCSNNACLQSEMRDGQYSSNSNIFRVVAFVQASGTMTTTTNSDACLKKSLVISSFWTVMKWRGSLCFHKSIQLSVISVLRKNQDILAVKACSNERCVGRLMLWIRVASAGTQIECTTLYAACGSRVRWVAWLAAQISPDSWRIVVLEYRKW